MRWSSGHGRNAGKRCSSPAQPAGLALPPSTSAVISACASSPVSAPTTRPPWCARYGAGDVVNYRSEDLRDRIKSITSGEGIDIGLDNVGGAIFEQMARLMKWDGRLMPIGFTSGEIPQITMNLPLLKNYAIIGVFVGAWAEKFPRRPRA